MKWFSLLYQGDVHPSTDEKVIPKEAFSKLLEAEEIIKRAKEDAEELLKKTEEKCEILRKEANEKGFNEGIEAFNDQIFSIDQDLKKIRLSLQQMVLPIALKAAKRIVAKELDTFPETIVDIVMQAIAPIAQSQQVTLFVSKEDKSRLEKEKPKLKEILEHAETLKIEEKPDLKPGDCVIKTEAGMISATLENQWRALEQAFEKYQASK
ncbi:MAG: Yop proteins translocation protein L [Chlamydiae bacterium]|nr:Yop proteins translocation protein L [Chlamydiota bacterium]